MQTAAPFDLRPFALHFFETQIEPKHTPASLDRYRDVRIAGQDAGGVSTVRSSKMSNSTLVIVVVIAVAVVLAVALMTRAQRRARLKARFGPEYNRVVERDRKCGKGRSEA